MKWLVGLILAMFLTVSTVDVAPVADAVSISAHRHHHHNHGKHKGQHKHASYYNNDLARLIAGPLLARPHDPRHHGKRKHAGRPQAGHVQLRRHHKHKRHHRVRHHRNVLPPSVTRQLPKRCVTLVQPTETRIVYREVPRTKTERVLYGTGLIAAVAAVVAIIALLAGYITGWIRRKHDEEKFLGSLLDDDK